MKTNELTISNENFSEMQKVLISSQLIRKLWHKARKNKTKSFNHDTAFLSVSFIDRHFSLWLLKFYIARCLSTIKKAHHKNLFFVLIKAKFILSRVFTAFSSLCSQCFCQPSMCHLKDGEFHCCRVNWMRWLIAARMAIAERCLAKPLRPIVDQWFCCWLV